MPGIHLVTTKSHSLLQHQNRLQALLRLMLYSSDYASHQIIFDEDTYLGFTGYAEYPVLSFETDNTVVVFEGYCYSLKPDSLERNLRSIAARLSQGTDASSVVKPWVLSADGDYVCLIMDKQSQNLWLFNDPMGRLPVYICKRPDMLLVSREVKFIAGVLPDIKHDQQGIAETLVFGYTLGHSTLMKDIHRLDAGTLISVDLRSLGTRYDRTYQFNFDALLDHPTKPTPEYAHVLCDRFLTACSSIKESFPDYSHVVSLSGGLDSRAVLAGMNRVKAVVSAWTFQDAETATRGQDALYAKKIARSLGIKWRLFDFEPLTTGDVENLVWIKDGLNFSRMSFIMPFLRKIKAECGPHTLYLTGDNGGHGMTEVQGARIRLKNFDDFCRFTVERHTRLRLEYISAMMGLSKKKIIEQIKEKLARYPERSMDNRYRHFLMAERLFNWNFQGEDRNRTYFWQATPFSSFPYFEYAMTVPDSARRHWKVFELFMSEIDPKYTEIPLGNWRAPITSYKRYMYPFRESIYERLPIWLRIAIRNRTLYRGLQVNPELRRYLSNLLEDGKTRDMFLDTKAVLNVASTCSNNEFHNMLTIVVYVQMLSRKLKALAISDIG